MRGQSDVVASGFRLESGLALSVQPLQVGSRGVPFSDVVEQVDEGVVLLAVDVCQFDGHVADAAQRFRSEEVRRIVILLQQFLLFRCHDRRELLQVADHEQLYASEGPVVFAETAQYGVDGIQHVRPYHAYLVDDQQVEGAHDSAFLLAVVKAVSDAGVGDEGGQWQLEE